MVTGNRVEAWRSGRGRFTPNDDGQVLLQDDIVTAKAAALEWNRTKGDAALVGPGVVTLQDEATTTTITFADEASIEGDEGGLRPRQVLHARHRHPSRSHIASRRWRLSLVKVVACGRWTPKEVWNSTKAPSRFGQADCGRCTRKRFIHQRTQFGDCGRPRGAGRWTRSTRDGRPIGSTSGRRLGRADRRWCVHSRRRPAPRRRIPAT